MNRFPTNNPHLQVHIARQVTIKPPHSVCEWLVTVEWCWDSGRDTPGGRLGTADDATCAECLRRWATEQAKKPMRLP